VDGLINAPFSFTSALTNSAIDSTQLMIAPLPDLYIDPSADRRRVVYNWFNDSVNRYLLFWVNPSLHYADEPYYTFKAFTDDYAPMGVWEQSAWLGLVPWLMLMVIVPAWCRRMPAALWLGGAFFSFCVTRWFFLKYVDSAGIYYSFSAALTFPAVAWLWDADRSGGFRVGIFTRLMCCLVLFTNLVSAANLFSYQRNVPNLWQSDFSPNENLVSDQVTAALRRAKGFFCPI
jgi:hypothetical protein